MEPGRIDSHIHLLPGLDDGPARLDEAVEMARALAGLGYTHACATPHQRRGFWLPAAAEIQQARLRLADELARQGVALELLPGAENHIDADLLPRLEAGAVPLLGLERALLLELPDLDMAGNLDRLLFELLTLRYRPVIAHPERHDYLFTDRRRVAILRERGALLQVCLASLDGMFGRVVARRATYLLEQDECDLVATDAHAALQVPKLVAPALKRLERLVGPATTRRLTSTAPARLLLSDRVALPGSQPAAP